MRVDEGKHGAGPSEQIQQEPQQALPPGSSAALVQQEPAGGSRSPHRELRWVAAGSSQPRLGFEVSALATPRPRIGAGRQ
jgi:hypothetical protein